MSLHTMRRHTLLHLSMNLVNQRSFPILLPRERPDLLEKLTEVDAFCVERSCEMIDGVFDRGVFGDEVNESAKEGRQI